MKTTKGKSGPAKPRQGMERVIKIYYVDGRKTIGQFNAHSFKDALKIYYERNWQAQGWDMKIVGNTMQVFKGENVRSFRALELYQEP